MSSKLKSIDMGLYPGGHPPSYNPIWQGLTSEFNGEKQVTLTAYTIHAHTTGKKMFKI